MEWRALQAGEKFCIVKFDLSAENLIAAFRGFKQWSPNSGGARSRSPFILASPEPVKRRINNTCQWNRTIHLEQRRPVLQGDLLKPTDDV
ncbi:hypothetical protein CEXT_573041 [Caerostris extrusa]|uniref:Uncharacterized protein n=1 Tax=Caerostris extrusa TaxID=172846 RepID=A0AAV4WPJ3_CAEEX|nr:hypothetical protein CEXT_573041 [Caerostris extrusa]